MPPMDDQTGSGQAFACSRAKARMYKRKRPNKAGLDEGAKAQPVESESADKSHLDAHLHLPPPTNLSNASKMAADMAIVSHQLDPTNRRLTFFCISPDNNVYQCLNATDVLEDDAEFVELYRALYTQPPSENYVLSVKAKNGSLLLLNSDQLTFVQAQFRSGHGDIALDQLDSFLSSGRGAPPVLLSRIIATLLLSPTTFIAHKAHRVLHHILYLQGPPAFQKLWHSFGSYAWPEKRRYSDINGDGDGGSDNDEAAGSDDDDDDDDDYGMSHGATRKGKRKAPLSQFQDFWALAKEALKVPKNSKEAREYKPVLLLFEFFVSILERDLRDKRPHNISNSVILTFIPRDDFGKRTRMEGQIVALARVFEGRTTKGGDGDDDMDQHPNEDGMELEMESERSNMGEVIEQEEDLEGEFRERVAVMQRVLHMLILLSFAHKLLPNLDLVRQTYHCLFRSLGPVDTFTFLSTLPSTIFATSLLDLAMHDSDLSRVPPNLSYIRTKPLSLHKLLHFYIHSRPTRLDPPYIWRHVEMIARLARSFVDEATLRCECIESGSSRIGVVGEPLLDEDGWEVWVSSQDDHGDAGASIDGHGQARLLLESGIDEEDLKVGREEGPRAIEEWRTRVRGWLEEGKKLRREASRSKEQELGDGQYEERIEWTLDMMQLCLEMPSRE